MSAGGPVALALTGASGAAYGLRLLECLLEAGREVWLMVSPAGRMVVRMESELDLPAAPRDAEAFLRERYPAAPGRVRVFGRHDWLAPPASGTGAPEALVVCPCTVGTLGAIAAGLSSDLIERAADVVLKERRRLVLVVRETPLSEIHLENMLRLSRMGAVVLPANPGFYHRPRQIGDLVDFVVARVLDQLGIPQDLLPFWGDERRD